MQGQSMMYRKLLLAASKSFGPLDASSGLHIAQMLMIKTKMQNGNGQRFDSVLAILELLTSKSFFTSLVIAD
jgi:hypothetical protein